MRNGLMQVRVRIGRTLSPVLVGMCVLTAAGCRDSLEPKRSHADEVASTASGRGALLAAADRDGEKLFRSLAKIAPSSAGFYYDEAGTIVIRVKDPKDDVASMSFIRELLRRNPGLNPGGGRLYLGIRVQRADFTFDELAAVRDAVSEHVLGTVPGVFSVDLDEKNNHVTVASN